MFAFLLSLVFVSELSMAAPAWLHLVANTQAAHVRVTEDLDAMLGPQRAFHYGGLENDGDYILDDLKIDAVLEVLNTHGIRDYRVRRPTTQLSEWFDTSEIEQEPVTRAEDRSVVYAAYRILKQLRRLDSLVRLNDEEREHVPDIPDATELRRCARTMARDLIQRLGKAHRSAQDVFVLTYGQSYDWAARDLIDQNSYLLWRYLAEVGSVIKLNRQTTRDFSRHDPAAAKRRWWRSAIELNQIGVTMGDAATDKRFDPQTNHMLEQGIGLALLRLSSLAAQTSVEDSIRSWYSHIETQVNARTDAQRFDRFGTAMDQDIARKAWAAYHAKTPWPADVIAAYARDEGVDLETAKNFLDNRTIDLDGGTKRVDGDFIFGKFMSELALGGRMVRDAYPGDRERLGRYYLGIMTLYSSLLATDPPTHPATHLTLLDSATLARAEMRRLLGPAEIKRGDLGEVNQSLRKLVIARARAFDLESCQAILSPRGLIPALRRASRTEK